MRTGRYSFLAMLLSFILMVTTVAQPVYAADGSSGVPAGPSGISETEKPGAGTEAETGGVSLDDAAGTTENDGDAVPGDGEDTVSASGADSFDGETVGSDSPESDSNKDSAGTGTEEEGKTEAADSEEKGPAAEDGGSKSEGVGQSSEIEGAGDDHASEDGEPGAGQDFESEANSEIQQGDPGTDGQEGDQPGLDTGLAPELNGIGATDESLEGEKQEGEKEAGEAEEEKKSDEEITAKLMQANTDTPVELGIEEREASETLNISVDFYAWSSSTEGTANYGLENAMCVWLEEGKNAADYIYKVTPPDGAMSGEMALKPTSNQRMARWQYVPEKGGVYTVGVYSKEEQEKEPLATAAITLYKITYHEGNGKIDGEQQFTYAEANTPIGLLPWPKVTAAEGGEGDKLIGWMINKPETGKPYTSDSEEILKTVPALQDKYEITLYACIGTLIRYSFRISEKKESDSVDPDKDAAVETVFEDLTYKYSADDRQTKTLYIHNTGTVEIPKNEIQILDDSKHFLYELKGDIPKNGYAELCITPQIGLGDGEYTDRVLVKRDSFMVPLTVKVSVRKAAANLKLDGIQKEYGRTLSISDIPYHITIGDTDVTSEAGSLTKAGVSIACDGFGKSAKVGETYPYNVTITPKASSNYTLQYASEGQTGIQVIQAQPEISSVTASGLEVGQMLRESEITGTAVNPYTRETIEGKFEWVNGDTPMNEEGTNPQSYRFVPGDSTDYKTVEATVNVTVSRKLSTEVKAVADLEILYDGNPHSVGFTATVTAADGRTIDRQADLVFSYQRAGESEWKTGTPVDAGEYTIKAFAPETREYAAGEAEAKLRIDPITVRLNVKSGIVQPKEYDGSIAASLGSSPVAITRGNMPMRDWGKVDVNPDAEYTAVYDSPSVGNNKQVTITLENTEGMLVGERAANYQIQSGVTLHTVGSITRKSVKIQLKEALTKEYGQSLAPDADAFELAAGEKLVGTDSMLSLGLQVTSDGFDASATAGTAYDIQVQTDAGSNYEVVLTGEEKKVAVTQAEPKKISVSAAGGKKRNKLETVKLMGTFSNPYSGWNVPGTFRWNAPETILDEEGSVKYGWTFVPEDTVNYKEITGETEVVVTKKGPAPLSFDSEESGSEVQSGTIEVDFDGNGHEVLVELLLGSSEIPADAINVEYAFQSLPEEQEPAKAVQKRSGIRTMSMRSLGSGLESIWSNEPPVHAGIWLVRATMEETQEYAMTQIEGVLRIRQAIPELESITASEVKRGSRLSESALNGVFKGKDGKPLEGVLLWDAVGGEAPAQVPVVNGKEYGWIFTPKSQEDEDGQQYQDYRRLSGTVPVFFEADHRKIESASVYNLPNEVGDLAVVTLDAEIYPDDRFTFYKDAACTDPVSNYTPFSERGTYEVLLDDDALAVSGGTIYVKIDGSDVVTPVSYKPEIGFNLPDRLQVYAGHGLDLEMIFSDVSYGDLLTDNVTWMLDSGIFAELEQSGKTEARVKGLEAGRAFLSVSAEFRHPAPGRNETFRISKTAEIKVLPAVGDLVITNTVKGSDSDPNKEFLFTISANLGGVPINGVYGGIAFINGAASFRLRHGQTMTISGLPEGISYTVRITDEKAEGYSIPVAEFHGSIAAGEEKRAEFIAEKSKPAQESESEKNSESEAEKNSESKEEKNSEASAAGSGQPNQTPASGAAIPVLPVLEPQEVPELTAASEPSDQFTGGSPNTSDESNPGRYLWMMVLSFAGLVFVNGKKKRRSR